MAFLRSALPGAEAQTPSDADVAAQPFIGKASNSGMDAVYSSVQQLNRKVWDDYYKNYDGRENKAYDQAFNGDFIGDARNRTKAALTSAQGGAASSASDFLSRYGAAETGDQTAGSNASTQLNNNAALVSGGNQARWSGYDAQQGLQDNMTNEYLGRVSDSLQNSDAVGLEAAQRKAAYIRYKAKKKAGQMGAVGMVAGLALAPFTGGASLALASAGASQMG